jgi:hypothetical protein
MSNGARCGCPAPEIEEMSLYDAVLRGYIYCSYPDHFLVGTTIRMKNPYDESVAYITLRDQIEVEWVKRGLL